MCHHINHIENRTFYCAENVGVFETLNFAGQKCRRKISAGMLNVCKLSCNEAAAKQKENRAALVSYPVAWIYKSNFWVMLFKLKNGINFINEISTFGYSAVTAKFLVFLVYRGF